MLRRSATTASAPQPARRDAHCLAWTTVVLGALVLAGCASGPPNRAEQPAQRAAVPPRAPAAGPAGDSTRDGPGLNPPPDLALVPDAQPQLEPVRPGGPNKPYEVLGQTYVPLTGDPPLVQRGLASWYGAKFHGRGTATGETYNMYAMTAAHRTMPLPSYARVRNPANGREVVVRVNDRGPFHSQRVIDLSYTAALKLGLLGGVGMVEVERITFDAIRTGAWRAPATLAGPAGEPAAQAATTALLLPGAASGLADDPIADFGRPGNAPMPPGPRPQAALAPAPSNDILPAAALAAAAAAGGHPLVLAPAGSPLPPETQAPASAATHAVPGFWLQLGAFAKADGAMNFQMRVARDAAWLAPLLAVFNERKLHRLQAGPYARRADAVHAGERLREALGLVPALVERR